MPDYYKDEDLDRFGEIHQPFGEERRSSTGARHITLQISSPCNGRATDGL